MPNSEPTWGLSVPDGDPPPDPEYLDSRVTGDDVGPFLDAFYQLYVQRVTVSSPHPDASLPGSTTSTHR